MMMYQQGSRAKTPPVGLEPVFLKGVRFLSQKFLGKSESEAGKWKSESVLVKEAKKDSLGLQEEPCSA